LFNHDPRETLRVNFATGEAIVRECRIWSNKNIVTDSSAVPELDAAFDRHSVTNNDVIIDENPGIDDTIAANARLTTNSRKRIYPRPRANTVSFAEGPLVDKKIILAHQRNLKNQNR
jgi:hypothetical protein